MNLATTAIVQHPAALSSHPHAERSAGFIGNESIAKSIQCCQRPLFALSLSLLEYPEGKHNSGIRLLTSEIAVPTRNLSFAVCGFLFTSLRRLPSVSESAQGLTAFLSARLSVLSGWNACGKPRSPSGSRASVSPSPRSDH